MKQFIIREVIVFMKLFKIVFGMLMFAHFSGMYIAKNVCHKSILHNNIIITNISMSLVVCWFTYITIMD